MNEKLTGQDSMFVTVKFEINTDAEEGKTRKQVIAEHIAALQTLYDNGTLAGNFQVTKIEVNAQ